MFNHQLSKKLPFVLLADCFLDRTINYRTHSHFHCHITVLFVRSLPGTFLFQMNQPTIPICSMYGIFIYLHLPSIYMQNVDKYTIHAAFGIYK